MRVTFGDARSKRGVLQHPAFLIAAVRVVLLAGLLISQTNRLGGATAAEVVGGVSGPIVGEYDVDENTRFFDSPAFRFTGFINMSPADGYIRIDVLKDATADPRVERNWQMGAGFAQITGSAPFFRFASPPLKIFNFTRFPRSWVDGGLGRARVVFVFRNDPSHGVLLPVQDDFGITPQNPYVIVFADVAPDRTNQIEKTFGNGGCLSVNAFLLDDFEGNATDPCTPNYLSANTNVPFFRPWEPQQLDEQRRNTMDYYRQIGTNSDGGGPSIFAGLNTLRKFRARYFPPFDCNEFMEPEAVTTYYNKGDLGIGREMHCSYNTCRDNQELACYVKNFGTRNGKAQFGHKAEAQLAVRNNQPFATVAMVHRKRITDRSPNDAPNDVFFVVYDSNGNLQFDAQLDRKGYNTSIPGNCLQCHGINSSYTVNPNHEVHRAMFLPFDLDSFEFFSENKNSPLSRVKQENAFRAQNRFVHHYSRLNLLPDAKALIEGWYNDDLFFDTSKFNGDFAPPGWMGNGQQQQLYRKVYARACRTCHISYEPVPADHAPSDKGDGRIGLQFGTYEQFLEKWVPLINQATCGPINPIGLKGTMPNAEQTLQLFWTTPARAQLFAQLPDPGPRGFRDCAPPVTQFPD